MIIAQQPRPPRPAGKKKPMPTAAATHQSAQVNNSDPYLPIARQVAAMLGEGSFPAFCQIYAIVKELGRDRVLALLRATLAIEQSGGQQIPDGSRRRTPGGVFFKLAKERNARAIVRHAGQSECSEAGIRA